MIRRILSAAAAVTVFASCAAAFAAGVPGAVNRAADSVVRITAASSLGTTRTGGIVISNDKKYVLAELRSVETGTLSVGLNEEQNTAARIAVKDAEKDIAVLELDSEIDGAKPAKFLKGELDEGDKVYALGYYSSEDEANITEGEVLSVNSIAADGIAADIYRINAAVTERNNGGMLADPRGAAAGICFYDGNTAENKVITSEEILSVLDENEIEYKKTTVIYLIVISASILAAVIAGAYLLLSAVKRKKESAPRLIGVSGEFAGQELPMSKENINIGRDAKICQIVILSDAKVSRCHCSVRYDGTKRAFILTDLSSTHGTYVNGAKLEPNVPRYITSGTVFNVGDGGTSFRTSEGR